MSLEEDEIINTPMLTQSLRDELIANCLEWERRFGVMPAITGAVAEFDAARVLGLDEEQFRQAIGKASAVRKGFDFAWKNVRYQVKGNRPSGGLGSKVTLVAKARNYEFDILIWILYDKHFSIEEIWKFEVNDYRERFHELKNIRPKHMRLGLSLSEKIRLFPERFDGGSQDQGTFKISASQEEITMIESSNSVKFKQRDFMRKLVLELGRDRDAVVAAYTKAEKDGLVRRLSGVETTSPEIYAAALWSDGDRKGWF